ncbi:65-kDa microtubule-associated protein 6 [Glycine soja]
MPDLVNLSLSAALKLSHCSSDDALDVPVKSLTNGFGSEPAFEPRVLKRTRGSLDRVKKPPTADKAFQDCLKDPFLVGAPKMVCFICKKKKQFWCVRCKVAFHSKCAAWSDSVLQLKDHPGHTVCWRHPYDWHLDWKVLQCVNEVHSLCSVLGLDFGQTVGDVHPSLHGTQVEQSTNISNSTLEGLEQAILKLKIERKTRISEAEVDRLAKLKASRMKELVFKKRSELEEICRLTNIEPDPSIVAEKASALIDSGLVDPFELLAKIEEQIIKAKNEVLSRKEVTDRIDKWFAACEEENWLDKYNQDDNRYNVGQCNHINLKRAERARITIGKIPGLLS